MNGDEIGLDKDLFQAGRFDAHERNILAQDKWVVADDFHPESGRPFRYDTTDVAEADNSNGLVAELDSDEFVAVPLAALQ